VCGTALSNSGTLPLGWCRSRWVLTDRLGGGKGGTPDEGGHEGGSLLSSALWLKASKRHRRTPQGKRDSRL
jgi:hypothetical protein